MKISAINNNQMNFSGKYYNAEAADLLCGKAAEWWGQKINILTALDQKPASENQIKIFTQNLKKNLEKRLKEMGNINYADNCSLCKIDWHILDPFKKALHKAGLKEDNPNPLKMYMELSIGKLKVRNGYQAPWETIYELPPELNKLYDTPPESNSKSLLQKFLGLFK